MNAAAASLSSPRRPAHPALYPHRGVFDIGIIPDANPDNTTNRQGREVQAIGHILQVNRHRASFEWRVTRAGVENNSTPRD